MFNQYYMKHSVYNDTNVNVENHSASNIMRKSMYKSKFKRFERGSKVEQTIFSDEPHLTKKVLKRYEYDPYSPGYEVEEKTEVVVLQVMLIDNNLYLVEYITKDDYLNSFEPAKIGAI